LLIQHSRPPRKKLKHLGFVDIYTAQDNNERLEFEQRYPQEDHEMASYIETMREESFQKGFQQGYALGFAMGMHFGMLKVAEKLLDNKLLTAEQIADTLGLPLQQIKELEARKH